MPLPRAALLATLLAALGGSGAAWSQQPPSVSDNDQLAREHFVRGRDAFSAGDFATSATEFRRAYELSHRSQLLYNIGTAYERLHNWDEALGAFQRYVREVPDAPDRREVEARIGVIEVEIQHRADPHQAAQPRVVVVERPVELPVEPSRPWRTAFWVGGGVAVLAGAATLTTGLLANGRYNALANGCGSSGSCAQIDVDDMRLRATIVNVGIVATSVLAAATATFFVLDLLRPQPQPVYHQVPTARAGFVPMPGGGLFAIEGTL